MKQLLTIALLISLLSCKSQFRYDKNGLEVATVHNMSTCIPVPEYNRKKFGYDSIQLLVDSGKITANFCYPNAWLYAKDTVYTGDTSYRLWGVKIHIDKDLWLTKKSGATLSMKQSFFTKGADGTWYLRGSVIIDDSIKVIIQRIKQ